MTQPRSPGDEASDPDTSPERLLELTQQHPQLHEQIVTNPSCPDAALQWILATNPSAKEAYEAHRSGTQSEASDDDAGAPTLTMQQVESPEQPSRTEPPTEPASPEQSAPPDPDGTSVWGEIPAASAWGGTMDAPPSVHVTSDRGVVPLGGADATHSYPAAPADGRPDGSAAIPVAGRSTPAAAGAAGGSAPAGGTAASGGAAASGGTAAAAGTAGGPAAPEETSRDRRRTWFACGGCLLLALILIVVAVLAGQAWLGGDSGEYERETEATTSQEDEPTAEETTEEPTEQDPVSPAPDGAAELEAIASPTGNITCTLEQDRVGCSVADRDFSGAGLEDCSDGPYSIQVADGEAGSACGRSFGADGAPTLEYDDSAVNGDVACTSRFDGMTCWNTMTGRGFFVNRVSYETF